MARETSTSGKELNMFAERLICSWIGALCLAAGAFCQTYVQISVDASTSPMSINKKGEIAGSYSDFAGNGHGFVRDPGGAITTFDVPGSSNTQAFSINDEGAITGIYTVPSGGQHAYVRDPEGNFTTFDPPGSVSTRASSINAGGAVTGSYTDSNNVSHSFLRHADGTFITFDPPGSVSINAKGEIAGWYRSDPGSLIPTHGFVRRPGGEIVSFDAPHVPLLTSVAGINDAGVITGSSGFGPTFFGFVRDPDGKFTQFAPGPITEPSSINNKGAITGSVGSSRTPFSGFVRSPEETITRFDPPFCLSNDLGATVNDSPTSINDEGVITGYCQVFTPQFPLGVQVGWVRFP
jgi:hypothetical protein